ncbi:MAG: hypothetical protein ISS10_02540 [Candidatus Marinimicrobia bacterium]|nr:hypothetical protein [Candidatus Neomarinimicrobiota bacterium]MBL7059858.1 hypothetical protein [Candidatus Neomarinimicrobiota bacterium]
MKTLFINIALVFMMTGIGISDNEAIYILHSNNTNGALENCYCPDHPLGSLEKRVEFVKSFLRAHPNTIIVDAGDLFSPVYRPLKDSLVAEAYKLIPYDAILPGDQELTRGQIYQEKLLRNTGADLVLSNYSSEWLPGMLSKKIIMRGGKKIAILGLLSERAFRYYPNEVKKAMSVHDPVSIIQPMINDLKKDVDVIILLTHQGFDADKELAEKLSGVDVIIGSHSQTTVMKPQEANVTIITQAGKNGYYMGVVKLSFNGIGEISSKTGWLEAMTLEMPDNPKVMRLIKEYEEKSGLVNRAKKRYKHP